MVISWRWHGFQMVNHHIILWLTLIQTCLTMFQLYSQQLGLFMNPLTSKFEIAGVSLIHLMHVIARTHISTSTTSLMPVKNIMHHFSLWHLLSGTLELRKWKNGNIKLNSWSFFIKLCWPFVNFNVVFPCMTSEYWENYNF